MRTDNGDQDTGPGHPNQNDRDHYESWLRLAHASGLSWVDRRSLLEHVEFRPERLFADGFDANTAASATADGGRTPASVATGSSLQAWINSARTLDLSADLEWLERDGHQLLTLSDSRYPALLAQIADPPLVLYVTGDVEILQKPQVAIVGSRRASPDGMRNAREVARDFANAGLVITSGLALGIDGAAHGAALDCGGSSVAVMATGADRIYPKRHAALGAAIAKAGALVTEFRCGVDARPFHFARRNRIISGLSLGTLVVQGAEKSGSLITARLAGAQGRDVFAMPGPAGVSQYAGCHRLIREGAALVEHAEQLIDGLGWHHPVPLDAVKPDPDTFGENCQSEAALLSHIGYSPVSLDDLVIASGLPAAHVAAEVIKLEVLGIVHSLAGGRVARRG